MRMPPAGLEPATRCLEGSADRYAGGRRTTTDPASRPGLQGIRVASTASLSDLRPEAFGPLSGQKHTEPRYPVGVCSPSRGPQPLLRPVDVADLLNVSRKTAYRLIAGGDLPAIRIGTTLRIRPADLVAYLDKRTAA